eukprot:9165887-Alexandrium_andersonii.AAC.1
MSDKVDREDLTAALGPWHAGVGARLPPGGRGHASAPLVVAAAGAPSLQHPACRLGCLLAKPGGNSQVLPHHGSPNQG